MLTLKTENPGAHVGGILWFQWQTAHRDYSKASILGLMKISAFELGITKEDGKTAPTNKCYAEDNNPWGMSCVTTRPTTQNGCRTNDKGEKFGKYPSVYAGVKDVFLWMDYNKIPDSVKNSDNPSDIIAFAEGKGWVNGQAGSMSGHKNYNPDLAQVFLDKGRNALLTRVGIYTALAIFVIGLILKGRKKGAFKKALGPLGVLVQGTKTRARRTRVRAQVIKRRATRRVAAIRSRYARKK